MLDHITDGRIVSGFVRGIGWEYYAHSINPTRSRDRFNEAHGIGGLADLPRPGVPRRLTETERGRIIALARSQPPGRLHQGGEGLEAPADPEAPAHWTLDALAATAQAEGIGVGRSQVRRILLAERVRWRRTRSWATSTDPDFAPKEPASSPSTPPRPRRRR